MGEDVESNSVLSTLLLNPEPMLERIERGLAGMDYDYAEKKWYKRSRALVNGEGISFIINMLRTHSPPNITVSKFDKDNIHSIMRRVMSTIAINLGDNYIDYDINPKNIEAIIEMVETYIYAALKRASLEGKSTQGHREIDHLSGAEKTQNVRQYSEEKKKGGFFK